MKQKIVCLFTFFLIAILSGCGSVKVQLISNDIKIKKDAKIAVIPFMLKNKTNNKLDRSESILFAKTIIGTLIESNYNVIDLDDVNKAETNTFNEFKEKKELRLYDYWIGVGKSLNADYILIGTGSSSITGKNTYVNRITSDFVDIKTEKAIIFSSYHGGGDRTVEAAEKFSEGLKNKLNNITQAQ